jgi:two-component system, cell cycle response regulator
LILPETSQADALVVAEKIRLAVEQQLFKKDQDDYRVTMSFGVAAYDAGSKSRMTKAELIEHADKALYAAKKKGRNRVEEYAEKSGWFGRGK